MNIFGKFGKRFGALALAAAILGAPLAAPVVAHAQAASTAASDAASSAPAAAAAPAAAPAATPPVKLDSGDTAWMLTSTALVLLMTIPGLALFYGGMVRKKNVIATLAQSFVITCLVTVLWYVCGYSLAFDANPDAGMNKFIGSFGAFFLKGVGPTTVNALAPTIPETVFIMFQMTFAIITPALIAGSFAERFKFSGLILFMSLWLLLIYVPIAHMVWGGGILGGMGVLDFAGGTVVHINAGIAGLMTALFLGKRVGYGHDNMAPHNLVLTMIGASLLWVGWFGFNAGSAVASNALAGAAMINTQIATGAAALAWMTVEWIERKKPGMLGLASGAVAGLVAITPASGFVDPNGALIIGIAAGVVCYLGAVWLKKIFKYDDSLDAFGVHCIGGILGALLTGVFASEVINPLSKGHNIVTQAIGVLATLVISGVGTLVILTICKFTTGVRVSEEAEVEGLDLSQHGESLHEH
jgi:Amt family ammonium transporter